MNSRYFYFNHYHLFVFILLFLTTDRDSFAFQKHDEDLATQYVEAPAANQILARDFKNYREFLYKNSRILIFKKSKNLNLFFIKGVNNLAITQNNTISAYEYLINSKSAKHTIVYKFDIRKKLRGNVAYYSKKNITYFKAKESSLDCSSEFKTLATRLGAKEIINEISNFNITNLIDKSSCSHIEKDKLNQLEEILFEQFNINASSLTECFNKSEVSNLLNKDQLLQSNSMSMMGRFLNLVDQISDGQAPLKIKCNLLPKDGVNVASYNEQLNPPEISINFENKLFTNPLVETPKEGEKIVNLAQIIDHELFHHGVQQYPLGSNQDCLDENFALLFDKICETKNFNDAKFPTSSEILNFCTHKSKGVHQPLIESKANIIKTSNGEKGSLAPIGEIQVSEIKLKQEQEAQITANLANTITPESFTPVDSSEITALANAPLSNVAGVEISKNPGVSQKLQLRPETEKSVVNLFSRLENSSNKMFQNFNRAVAMTMPNANASASAINPNSSIPITNSKLLAAKYSPQFDGTLIQERDPLFNNQNSTVPGSSKTLPIIHANVAPVIPSEDGPTDQLKGSKLSSKPINISREPASTNKPGNQVGKMLESKNTAGAEAFIPNQHAETTLTKSIPSTKIKQVNSSQVTRSPSSSLDNQALQILTAFNHMTGSQYSQIKKMYNNPEFEALLARRGISITFLNESNKPVKKIGSKENIRYSFTDNGNALTKVETRK